MNPLTKKPFLILCVDDEKAILDTLQRQLSPAFGNEAEIEVAESAEEAWEIIEEYARTHILSVVVSDWLMPVTRGDKFLVELHKKYPHVTKILLSGHADPKAVQNARDNAALQAFLSKPWDKNKLLSEIRAGLASVVATCSTM
jgi:DNA-binding NtrC family response regulator